jgi:cytochrome c biogenesis protein ResB
MRESWPRHGKSFAQVTAMRYAAVAVLAIGAVACSRTDQDRARERTQETREQARRTAEQLRQNGREALHDAKTDAQKASRELNKDLNTTRDKIRKAVDAPPRDDHDR